MASAPWWHWVGPIVLLVAATVLTYWPTLSNDFVNWDDNEYLIKNAYLDPANPDGLNKIWDYDAKQNQYYPIVFTSFWIEHRLELWQRAKEHGVTIAGLKGDELRFNPRIYHTTNMVLHAIDVGLVFWLMRLLGLSPWVAWLTAGLFALHPINVASVSWAAERKNVLSGLFYLLSLIFYIRSSRRASWANYGICLAFYILALLSKSACVTLSATIIISDRLVLRRWTWQSFARIIPFVLLGLVAARATSYHEHQNRQNKAGVVFLDIELRPLAAAGATWFYVGKVLWPVGFPGVYPRWEILKNWPLFIAALFALPVLGFALWKLRRKIAPPALWGVAHYILCLSPMLGLIPFNYTQFTFVADHFVYLPIIGVFLCLALVAEAARRRFKAGWVGAVPMTTLAAAVLIALGVISYRHNADNWKDGKSFWEYTVKLNRLCWPAQYNLANLYARDAAALRKQSQKARVAQDDLAANQYAADARIIEEAVAEHYEWATVANPNLIPVERACANAYVRLRQYDKAAEHLQRAIDIMTREGQRGHFLYQDRLRLHKLLTRAGKPEEAEVPLRDLIAAEPETFDPSTKTGKVLIQARLRLGGILHARKEYDEAIEHYERVLEIDPDNVAARRSVEVSRRARDREAAAESSP